jgi:hypothetical protein
MIEIDREEWFYFMTLFTRPGFRSKFRYDCIKYQMNQINSSYIMNETCHFCDTSLLYQNTIYFDSLSKLIEDMRYDMTKNERTLQKYGWKLDKYALPEDPVYERYKRMKRTRDFIDNVNECERLYGELKKPIWM